MKLPKSLQTDFQWWLRAIENPAHRIRDDYYVAEIFTDASTSGGWGAACGEETASGPWSESERELHINCLELLAAFFGLKIFAKDYNNCQILLRVDNSTAIAYINRMGGIQYPHLTAIAKQIWQWCETRKIFVYASYIKSSDNVIADAESRKTHPDIEWELTNAAYHDIIKKFFCPDIDLFASRINKKCTKYVSWHRDPDAFASNAFTIDWADMLFYAFPPFPVILKTLRKIVNDRATGIMVVPVWPTQPWYPLFRSLVISEIRYFMPNERVILSHSRDRNIHSNLTLAAAILSGRHYCGAIYHPPR
ncbi:hypothetical protein O0L34_g10122 [Tuta absoluta]|nr:hypothetical protein O0L34_g10122 [Tuta absoluta]